MDFQECKIGIVIPVYNKERFISTTLDSINNLTIKPNEVIIIDDGSTDRSLEIIKNIKLKTKCNIITQRNQGVSKARNIGIKESISDYILFLDADDILHQDALVYFNEYINRGYKIIAGNRINKNGNISVDTNSDIEFTQIIYLNKLYKNINLCWTSAVLLKKDLLFNNNFNEKFSHGEDRELFYRVLKDQKAIFIKNVVAEYINDDYGLSNKIINPDQDLFFILLKNISSFDTFNFNNFIFLMKYKFKRFNVSIRNSKIRTAIKWLVE